MPYELFKQDGKFCVRNKQTGESKGCSANRKMAIQHMRALYAAEGGAKMGKKELDELVEKSISAYLEQYPGDQLDEKELEQKGYVPYGVKTFQELDSYREAKALANEATSMSDDLYGLIQMVMWSEEVTDKATAIKSLADEFATRVDALKPEPEDDMGEDKSLEDEECAECDEEPYVKEADWIDEEGEPLDVKAVWTTASVNNLPDSAFLYVAPNCGSKDSEGKTKPRSCRKFPVKDASGKADLAHVRNAIARIPQATGLSAETKKRLQARARNMLASAKKESEEVAVLDKVKALLDGALEQIKSMFKPANNDEQTAFMTFKGVDGKLHWLATYSNNFRDDDNPREIISDKSHRRFVDLVDKGQAEMPELWVWHRPEWKFGRGTWVAYDDKGFSVAAGDVDPGCEEFAEYLSSCKSVRLSHGMPYASIRRDPEDSTVILEHETKEISVLPEYAAANKYTSFVLLKEQDDIELEENMAIPKGKLDALVSKWGEGVKNQLEKLEEMNADSAKKAAEEGRDTKSKDDAVEEAVQEEQVQEAKVEETEGETETETQTEQTESVDFATTEEIAQAFASTVKPFVDELEGVKASQAEMAKALEALTKEISALKEGRETSVKSVLDNTPSASVAAMIARSLIASSSPETTVDGRSALGKDKPAETITQTTGIPFIDQMLSQAPEK